MKPAVEEFSRYPQLPSSYLYNFQYLLIFPLKALKIQSLWSPSNLLQYFSYPASSKFCLISDENFPCLHWSPSFLGLVDYEDDAKTILFSTTVLCAFAMQICSRPWALDICRSNCSLPSMLWAGIGCYNAAGAPQCWADGRIPASVLHTVLLLTHLHTVLLFSQH